MSKKYASNKKLHEYSFPFLTETLLKTNKLRTKYLRFTKKDVRYIRITTETKDFFGTLSFTGRFRPGPEAEHDWPHERKVKYWNALLAVEKNPPKEGRDFGIATGVCTICGRALTDSESIAFGIGPDCRKKLNI